MDTLRNWLLGHNEVDLYESILAFLHAPDKNDLELIIKSSPKEIADSVESELYEIMRLFAEERESFYALFTYGQTIIWEEVLKTYKILCKNQQIIERINLSPDLSNYEVALNELKKILTPYSIMQIALSDLEEVLGVDRFLDRVSQDTFVILKRIVDDAKTVVEKKTEIYKLKFQDVYNTTNVYNVVAHSLIRRDDHNQLCDRFLTNNKQVILLVVDGFGFCQYLWNCGIDASKENFTFKENIFNWLTNNHLLKDNIIGSSFVTDTGAGLAQIYYGQKSGSTGIYASKIKNRISSNPFIETKKINVEQYDSLFSCPSSITDIVSTYNDTPVVYYCSKYQSSPSGFSSSIFKSAKVRQVIPSERVFSMILEDISGGQINGLQVVYLTSIDNSGHTMGAYSSFERLEHKKIDYLLRNFLIELAYKEPSLFDSKRSIMLTADHGMYESSKIMVSRQNIIDYLNICGIKNIKLVENNRALFIYNEGDKDNEIISQTLKDYFKSKQLKIDVQTKTDIGFKNCLYEAPQNEKTIPDIVARFIGEGLFYSNPNANDHLLHFGGHGGYSVDEVFVPLLEIPLSNELLKQINNRFLSRK